VIGGAVAHQRLGRWAAAAGERGGEARVEVQDVERQVRFGREPADEGHLAADVEAAADPVAHRQPAADQHQRLASLDGLERRDQVPQAREALLGAHGHVLRERHGIGLDAPRALPVGRMAGARHDARERVGVAGRDVEDLGGRERRQPRGGADRIPTMRSSASRTS
jgi:hypothetical protein